MKKRARFALALGVTLLVTAGCGRFIAHRMVQSPNTYPSWLRPNARVALIFDDRFLTNFPSHTVKVGPPEAKLRYRIVEPGDSRFQVSSTNWVQGGKQHAKIAINTRLPTKTNTWTQSPRGTVVLLHGYGLAQFAMTPWALSLAQDGWRCVLVDLRGHGKSTGKKISYGVTEVHDLSQLLDALSRDGKLAGPVAVMGDSYGAALAVRWKTVEPRLNMAIAISPYSTLSNATLNIVHENASWVPRFIIRAGLKELPGVMNVPAAELDTTTVLARHPVQVLFVTGEADKIAPVADVQKLRDLAAQGSEFFVIPKASHETAPYFFKELAPQIHAWLETGSSFKTK